MRIHPLTKAMTLAFFSAGLVACGGDDDDSSDGGGGADTTAEVRVVHASSDAPNVNAGLNGGGQVSDLAYGNATNFLKVPAKDYDVTVSGIRPDGSTPTDIGPVTVPVEADKETSIIALGNVGGSGNTALGAKVVTAPDEDPASGNARIQVVHASAAAASANDLDVYLTQPSKTPSDSGVDPVASFTFKGVIGPTEVASGDYRVWVTPQGNDSKILFKSGTVTLPDGADVLLAAIDNTGPAKGPRNAPIRLLQAAEGSQSQVLLDAGAQAGVRAAHLSADAGTVDISVDGVNSGNPVVTGLTFDNSNFADNFTSFLGLPAGQQTVNVEQNGSVVVSASPQLEAGERYTGYALGLVNPQRSFEALSLEAKGEDQRPVATEAKVRVVHAASQVPFSDGKVDVYLVADQSATVSDLGDSNRILNDIPFKAISAYLSVPPGSNYKVFITKFDDATTAPIMADLPQLQGGGVYTVAAVDKLDSNGNVSGVAPSPKILVDNTP